METLWERVKEDLKGEMDETTYTLWVKPLQLLNSGDASICVGCPNKFSRDWIQEHYTPLIQRQFSKIGVTGRDVVLKVLPKTDFKKFNGNGSNGNGNGKQLALPSMPKKILAGRKYLNSRFTFDKFVIGECNEFAFSVSRALANDAHCFYKSLFLLGETGLGKSHLVHAIGNYILEKKPTVKVFYITAEDFANEMIHALKNNQIEQFKEKYRRLCDVLLLEEVHFLGGKEKIQVELGYTLDYLLNDDKRVIFTSLLPPEKIPNMKKMLTSRLNSGVMTSLERPGLETRMQILRRKASERDISVSEDVAFYLAENLTQDVRQLEGCLDSLKASSLFLKKEVNMDLVKELIKQLGPAKPLIAIEDIQKIVCRYFKTSIEALKSKSRKKVIAYPRSVAIYLCRRYTEKSSECIGRLFNRNHSTILYDDDKIKKKIKTEEGTRKEIEFLCRQIEHGVGAV